MSKGAHRAAIHFSSKAVNTINAFNLATRRYEPRTAFRGLQLASEPARGELVEPAELISVSTGFEALLSQIPRHSSRHSFVLAILRVSFSDNGQLTTTSHSPHLSQKLFYFVTIFSIVINDTIQTSESPIRPPSLKRAPDL